MGAGRGQVVLLVPERRQQALDLLEGRRLVLGEAMLDHEVGRDRAVVGAEPRHPAVELRERAHQALVTGLRDLERLAVAIGHLGVLRALADEQLLEVRLLLDEALLVADLDAVERWDGGVDVPALHELLHLAEEEREQQRADVRAVDVGVGHDDDPVVAQLFDVELGADPAADRGHDRLDLEVREHLVDAVLLRVDDLAAEREDRLEVLVARVDGGPAGRVPLDEIELAALGIGRLAVGEPAGQAAARERALAGDLARLAGRLPCAGGVDRLRDDLLALVRVLVEELGELLVDDLLHEAAHPRDCRASSWSGPRTAARGASARSRQRGPRGRRRPRGSPPSP